MASISNSSLSFSFAPIDARPHKKQKTQQRFELIDGGFQENTRFETLYHKPPFQFARELCCTVGNCYYPIALIGRVALFDALPCLKILEKHLPEGSAALTLQQDYEPYSAFHWSLRAPGTAVSEYFLEKGPHLLACRYGKDAFICDACIPKVMDLVEKTQRHLEITSIAYSNLLKLQNRLAFRLGQRVLPAWESKNIPLIHLCFEKGTLINRNTMGKMLLQGIANRFDAGVYLLLGKHPSLATYATPDTGGKLWGLTALHVAAAAGRTDLFCLLFGLGADPQARTSTRKSRRPRETYWEYGLRERTNRGFTNLVDYANNLPTGSQEHWDVFSELDFSELSHLLRLFVETYSLFSSPIDRRKGKKECQRTEEAIACLLQSGANPGIPDRRGVCLFDWIKNRKYLVYIDPTPFFTSEYVTRIIQRMKQSATVHSLSQLIAEFAEVPEASVFGIIWNASNRPGGRRQDPLLA